MSIRYTLITLLFIACQQLTLAQNGIVVFQSDFGLKDGAVSAMKGVAVGVSPNLKLFDLTHEIPAFNIWEASYRLYQTVPYYPKGTVFVSVCDPGVGTDRHSVVLLTKSGHYIVTPDNGTLTLIADNLGIAEIREIDEAINRLKNSSESYTFHGRDVYAYTAARLAARVITFQQVGSTIRKDVVHLPYQKAESTNGIVKGNIPALDVQYGNVWTNIPKAMITRLGVKPGDMIRVQIINSDNVLYNKSVRMVNTFGEASLGDDVAYINSRLKCSLGVNQGDFSEKYKGASGSDWKVVVSK